MYVFRIICNVHNSDATKQHHTLLFKQVTLCTVQQEMEFCILCRRTVDRDIPSVVQAVRPRPLTVETLFRFQVSSCGICGAPTCTGRGFSAITLISPVSIIPPLLHTHPSIYHPHSIIFFSQHFSLPCQYHSTIAPYPFIHLPPTLHNVFLPALQFSPVTTIPPLLHTHLHLKNIPIRRTSGRNLENLKKKLLSLTIAGSAKHKKIVFNLCFKSVNVFLYTGCTFQHGIAQCREDDIFFV